MLTWLFGPSASRRKASELYGAVVAQARERDIFADLNVADTPEGRFEVLVLHLFLVMERLRAEGGAADEMSRTLMETFVTDMDDNMREMGVGDLTVPKKVKKAAAAFYDRAEAYRAALASADPGALAAALEAAIPATDGRPLEVSALAQRVCARRAALAGAPVDGLFRAGLGGEENHNRP